MSNPAQSLNQEKNSSVNIIHSMHTMKMIDNPLFIGFLLEEVIKIYLLLKRAVVCLHIGADLRKANRLFKRS